MTASLRAIPGEGDEDPPGGCAVYLTRDAFVYGDADAEGVVTIEGGVLAVVGSNGTRWWFSDWYAVTDNPAEAMED